MPRRTVIITLRALFAALLVASAWVIPNCFAATGRSSMATCINNLRQFEEAKEQWALEHHKTTNDTPSLDDLRPYMGRGSQGTLPICPAGGTYTPGKVGESPKCSIGGPNHTLDYDDTPEEMRGLIMLGSFSISLLGLVVAFFVPLRPRTVGPALTAG